MSFQPSTRHVFCGALTMVTEYISVPGSGCRGPLAPGATVRVTVERRDECSMCWKSMGNPKIPKQDTAVCSEEFYQERERERER